MAPLLAHAVPMTAHAVLGKILLHAAFGTHCVCAAGRPE